MTERKLFKCFDRRLILMALGGGLVLVGTALLGRLFERGTPARLAIAVLQSGVIAFVIAISVSAVRRLDELEYRMHLEAMAFAFAVTGVLLASWGFLEKAGAPIVSWALWGWPVMVGLWGGGLWIQQRRYR